MILKPKDRQTLPEGHSLVKHHAVACEALGKRIRRARGDLPRTLVAWKLGVSWSLLQKWEEGRGWPRVTDLMALCDLLGRDPLYFLWGIDGGPSIEDALLSLHLVSERDLLEAKAYIEKRKGESDRIDEPVWRRAKEYVDRRPYDNDGAYQSLVQEVYGGKKEP